MTAILKFANYHFIIWGRLAQLVEQLTLNQRVAGSNPAAPTSDFFSFLNFLPCKSYAFSL